MVDPYDMNLTLMTDMAASRGAVCLDGSPGGYYYRPALDAEHQNDWVLHFKGAGWCYDKQDCLARSEMQFGSSTFWPNASRGWGGGILSPDDPTFGKFNKIILLYCDGASFTGDRELPVVVTGSDGKSKPLYFRGKRVMDAILDSLKQTIGLGNARDVLLTGCSSGGLAAYLHADHVHERLKTDLAPATLRRFKVLPGSGFFLEHDTVEGKPVYADQIRNIFALSNSTGGVPAGCIAAFPDPADHYKCMFAQHAYAHIKAPVFLENSALDAFQMWCIFSAEPIAG
jgi:hypothetical protein